MSEKNKMKRITQTRRIFGECRPSPRTVVFSCMICKSTTLVGSQLYAGFPALDSLMKNRHPASRRMTALQKKCNNGVKTQFFISMNILTTEA